MRSTNGSRPRASFGRRDRSEREGSAATARAPNKTLLRRRSPAAVASGHKKGPALQALSYSGCHRTRDLRVMSPTSYLTAPPRDGLHASNGAGRGGGPPLAGAAFGLPLECAAMTETPKGRRDRHRHQLGPAADRRSRCRARDRARAPKPGYEAGAWGRPHRQLSVEAIEAACEAMANYVEVCERQRRRVEAIATSAVRDAAKGSVRRRAAGAVRALARVLDGEEEARLTYLGATSERRLTSQPLSSTSAAGRPS